MKLFKDKVALVSGASTGVGETIAEELFERGAIVVITARNMEELGRTARRIDPSGERVIPMTTDVRDHESVRMVIEQTLKRCGYLHFLVNNAGITGPHGVSICDYEVKDWHDIIETDLSSAFYGMKYALPAIIGSGGGAIVNLSAVNGIVGIAGIAPYTAAKHTIIGLTQSAALEFAEKGVRINAVGPGYVDTPRMRLFPDEVRKEMAASHPMKRMASRRDVAKTVAFLLSDDSAFTTGAFYAVDGGYTAR